MTIDEIIELLSLEYGFRKNTIKKYYDVLKKVPVFKDEDAMECLSIICEEKAHAITEMIVTYQDNESGLITSREQKKTKSVGDIIRMALREVYADYYEVIDKFNGNSMIYDETEFDVMEREEIEEDTIWSYVDEITDIRLKDREAYEKTKKKKDVQE